MGRLTGIQESSNVYFPYSIFVQFMKLVINYGGSLDIVRGKKKEITAMTLKINSETTLRNLFHNRRLNGVNHLAKRKVSKVKGPDGKSLRVQDGHSKVVATKLTPVVIEYKMKTMVSKVRFYIQRYNKSNEAMDARLQALLNGVV